MQIVLASSSKYRQALLQKLNLPFVAKSPDIDETARTGESPEALVKRLAQEKAAAVADVSKSQLVIGSDQLVAFDGHILGKPHTDENAISQLSQFSGKSVTFLTSICLLHSVDGVKAIDTVPTTVTFRHLSLEEIKAYVALEQPLDCAGSFKSEGMGISLFEKLDSTDPNALVGLPLIRLNQMLLAQGVNGLLGRT